MSNMGAPIHYPSLDDVSKSPTFDDLSRATQISRTTLWSSISIGRGHSIHTVKLSCASYMRFRLTRACNLNIWNLYTKPFQLMFMLMMIQTTHCISIIGMSKVMGSKTREGAQCIKNQVGFDYDVIHTCMCDKCLYYEQNEYFSIVLSVACQDTMTIQIRNAYHVS